VVRTSTQDQEKSHAQWCAVWSMLSAEWKAAIFRFCMQADRDVASAVWSHTYAVK
jgi:hypothetical protein